MIQERKKARLHMLNYKLHILGMNDDLCDGFCGLGNELGKGVNESLEHFDVEVKIFWLKQSFFNCCWHNFDNKVRMQSKSLPGMEECRKTLKKITCQS